MGVDEAGLAGHDAGVDADEEEDEVWGDGVAEEADGCGIVVGGGFGVIFVFDSRGGGSGAAGAFGWRWR